MSKHILGDAKRCLQCKNPVCEKGCPIGTPIKEVISLLLNSRLEEAGRILFENNPLSLICSHVCHQEMQCEGACILAKKDMPVAITTIERYISDFYLNICRPETSTKESGKIAVIGSGPAGMVVALMMARKNYNVTVFEGKEHIGGILRYGIPEFRLPKVSLERKKEMLYQSGVFIRPNTTIGINFSVDDLFRDGYHAVFMGTGVWRPLRLNIKGESLGNVHYAIEYLKNPSVYRLGKSLIIIGAGNVAMDVARTAIRQGCRQVRVFVHMDESVITARENELEYAKINGVQFEFMRLAMEITDNGVIFADTQIIIDENGNKRPSPMPQSEKLELADTVIVAVSQGPRSVIVSTTTGIQVNEKGLVVADENGQTTREGVFAAGDVVTGPKTVVDAAYRAKCSAEAMDRYIKSKYPKLQP
jgi:glutamate synthase (NADPH/NADH) small chain